MEAKGAHDRSKPGISVGGFRIRNTCRIFPTPMQGALHPIFRTDFINAFNHVQLNAPNMTLGPTMGQITSAQNPRNIQLALKLYF